MTALEKFVEQEKKNNTLLDIKQQGIVTVVVSTRKNSVTTNEYDADGNILKCSHQGFYPIEDVQYYRAERMNKATGNSQCLAKFGCWDAAKKYIESNYDDDHYWYIVWHTFPSLDKMEKRENGLLHYSIGGLCPFLKPFVKDS